LSHTGYVHRLGACSFMIGLLLNGFRVILVSSVGWGSMGVSLRAMAIAMRFMVGCVDFERRSGSSFRLES